MLEEQEAKLTDYQDYLFYSRVVGGIEKQQNKTRDARLRYQNQALIDHINYIRHCQTPPRGRPVPKMPSINSQLSHLARKGVLLAVQETLALADDARDDEETLIFDIDI